tara:strand:- start:4308 stop:5048 length:741 start_codon:yes stop_codon:yes gene_type:complete
MSNLMTCETECGKFTVMNTDFIGIWLLEGKHFEIECIRELEKHLQPGDNVLDIGANIGCYAIPLAKKVGPNGRLFAFEPQGPVNDLLVKNIEQNELKDIAIPYHFALGHKNGVARMNKKCDQGIDLDYSSKTHVNYGGINLGSDGEEVPMLTVDTFVEQWNNLKIKMIKIDVEGAERMVLAGAKRTIELHRPIVFFEDNFKSLTHEMVNAYNLPDHIVNMNMQSLFKDYYKYSQIIKVKENYLCIP